MFAIGDKIVYPMHGAGIIEEIVPRNIGGNQVNYYIIHIVNGNIKLSLPVENKSEIALRPVISEQEAKSALASFETEAIDPPPVWNKRYQLNVSRLKKGDIDSVSQVVQELMVRDATHGLSTGDRKMLILARNIFMTELSIALGADEKELGEHLVDVVQQKLNK